jgi:hypothetical protein
MVPIIDYMVLYKTSRFGIHGQFWYGTNHFWFESFNQIGTALELVRLVGFVGIVLVLIELHISVSTRVSLGTF